MKAGDGTRLGAVTRERLSALVGDLAGGDPWVVLEREDQVFAQALHRGDGIFTIGHRDGGPDAHFGAILTGEDDVVDLFWSWVADDPVWRTRVDWEPVEF